MRFANPNSMPTFIAYTGLYLLYVYWCRKTRRRSWWWMQNDLHHLYILSASVLSENCLFHLFCACWTYLFVIWLKSVRPFGSFDTYFQDVNTKFNIMSIEHRHKTSLYYYSLLFTALAVVLFVHCICVIYSYKTFQLLCFHHNWVLKSLVFTMRAAMLARY